jgi:hypothetical protein
MVAERRQSLLFYIPADLGMESFPEGLMRLGGFVFRAERDTPSSTT